MSETYRLDLVALVPDKNMQVALESLLSERTKSLGIRKIDYKILVHPNRDPGCFLEAPEVLRPYLKEAEHALVILDHEGSGREEQKGEDLAENLRGRLSASGWGNRAAALVIEPELEAWVWSGSPKVDEVLGWKGRSPKLREWLKSEKGKLWPENNRKPLRPKEAMEAALRQVRIIRSSSIYGRLAGKVSLAKCADPSFNRLKEILRTWFRVQKTGDS